MSDRTSVPADSDAPTPREAALREALETQRSDYLAKHVQSERDAHDFGPNAGANGRWKARAEGIEAALFILATLPPAAASTAAAGEGATGDVDAAWDDLRPGEDPEVERVAAALVAERDALSDDYETLVAEHDKCPSTSETPPFDRERFDMETAQLRAGIRKRGEESDNWPDVPQRATSETPRETPLAATGIDVERLRTWVMAAAGWDEDSPYTMSLDRLLAARGSE